MHSTPDLLSIVRAKVDVFVRSINLDNVKAFQTVLRAALMRGIPSLQNFLSRSWQYIQRSENTDEYSNLECTDGDGQLYI